jgi:hypothetical protein
MKLKQLEGLLGGLTQFPEPKVVRRVSPFSPISPRPQIGLPKRAGEKAEEFHVTFAACGGGAGGAGAVPDGPSHRVANALHGKFCAAPCSDSHALYAFVM